MIGTYTDPVLVPALDLNEFATFVFGAPFDFEKVMEADEMKYTHGTLYRFYVDGHNCASGGEWSDMEQRTIDGHYPRFGVWTVLNIFCRLGLILPGYYQILRTEAKIGQNREETVTV